jgi:hypothetical protein
MMEAIHSFETSILTRAKWHNIPEDGILQAWKMFESFRVYTYTRSRFEAYLMAIRYACFFLHLKKVRTVTKIFEIAVCWNVMPLSMLNTYRYFVEICRAQLHGHDLIWR